MECEPAPVWCWCPRLAWAWRDSSFPQGFLRRAAAGTATGKDSSLGPWGEQCLQPMLCCPDGLSRHPMTRGPEDLLPTSVLPDAPLSLHVHGSKRGQPATLCSCAGLTLVLARQAAPAEVCVAAETRQQKPSKICRASGGGKHIHPHVQDCQEGHPLSSDPAFSSATSLVGQHPSPVPASTAAAPSEQLSPWRWPLDSTKGLSMVFQKSDAITAQSKTDSC